MPLASLLRQSTVAALVGAVAVFAFSGTEACGGCHEGTCECADGTTIRVAAAPCECSGACASHGGVCADDYAGCPIDAGDASDAGAGDADAWPFPWDSGSG